MIVQLNQSESANEYTSATFIKNSLNLCFPYRIIQLSVSLILSQNNRIIMILEQTTLDNGLRTLFIDSPGSNTATIQIWFKAGSALEEKSNQGIAHFLEHMFFKGTKKYPDTMIAKTIESFGGELNAFTSFDYTCYYINAPSKNILKSLDVLLDMVSNPMFNEKDIIPEKEVVFEEYRRSIDSSSQYNFFELQKTCFSGTYGHPILGTEDTIKNFSQTQLKKFRNDFYNLSNAFFVVGGDLSSRSAIKKHINMFKLPEGPASQYKNFNLKKSSKVRVHNKATNQATISFTIQSPSYNDEASPVEDLALNCLTFGDISPLYKDLISSKQIASTIGGSTLFFNKKGCHLMRATMPVENIHDFIKEFEKSLVEVFKKGFSLDEIDRIRKQYIASKIYEKETIESYAFSLGQGFAQTGDIHCEGDFIEKMKNASRKHVHKALLSLFSKYIHNNVQLPNDVKDKTIATKLESFKANINNQASKILKTFSESSYETSKYDPEVKCIELKKNIKLLYRHNSMTPTFALHAYLKGGVAHETPENSGIFNLIAKSLTYGHKSCKYEDLKLFLETNSSYLNGFSGKNAYGITLHGLSENFPELVNHFFNSLLHPTIPTNYLKLDKELLKRSIHLQKEDPLKHCFKTFTKLVFNGHPYAMDLIGNEKSIKRNSRKLMLEKHAETLKKSEIVFTYCGDKDIDSVLELIEPFLKDLKGRADLKKNKHKVTPIYNVSKKIAFDREQTHIMIGKAASKIGNNDDLCLKMFTALLSGQSSELFATVRDEMGLCYSVQPIHLTALEAGYWGIYIGAGHDKKDLAIAAIMNILKKYQTKGISKKEFKRVKDMMMGQTLLSVQTNDDYANFYSISTLHKLGLDFQHITYEKINNLKHEEFNKYLGKFLKDKWNTIEVGPQK